MKKARKGEVVLIVLGCIAAITIVVFELFSAGEPPVTIDITYENNITKVTK